MSEFLLSGISCAIISITTEFLIRFLYLAASSSSCMSLIAQKMILIISPAEMIPCIHRLNVFNVSITHRLLGKDTLCKRSNVHGLEYCIANVSIAAGGDKEFSEYLGHRYGSNHAGDTPEYVQSRNHGRIKH